MADITALCERVLLIYAGELIYDGKLSGLLDQFAPYRQVTVELRQCYSAADLAHFANVEAVEGYTARFLVDRDRLTDVVSRLLAQLEVVDLQVTDPPIEEVIGRVFEKGQV